MTTELTTEIKDLCQRVFGKPPQAIKPLGGKHRAAFEGTIDGSQLFFVKRQHLETAQIEAAVLTGFATTRFTPNLKIVSDRWVVQEFINGTRLPLALDALPAMNDRQSIVAQALDALLFLHNKAASFNLHQKLPRVGGADGWLEHRVNAPARISKLSRMTAPNLNLSALVNVMNVPRDEFVKWDARPGNAFLSNNEIVWFDWEHCAQSKALDDLAFVLCDEWTTLDGAAETALIAQYFDRFNRSLSHQRGEHYLRTFGVAHCLLRLETALSHYHREGKWWDRDFCLQNDKIGVTPQEVSRQIHRAKRWADGVKEYKPLISWLNELIDEYGP